MRSALWLGALAALVFGIGWESSRIFATSSPPSNPNSQSTPRGIGWGDRDHGHRFEGPLFGSIGHLVTDLGLTDEQREQVSKILDAASVAMREHEDAMHEIRDKSRSDLLAILTDEQRAKMKELTEQMFERHRRERVASNVAWFKKNAQFDAATMKRVETLLSDYESDKQKVFASFAPFTGPASSAASGGPGCAKGSETAKADPNAPNPMTELTKLRDQLEANLSTIADKPTLDRFHAERLSFDRRGPRGGRMTESNDEKENP